MTVTRLAKISSGSQLQSGIFPSLHGDAAPFWKDSENVLFQNGGVRKARGILGLENLAARPTGLASAVTETEARLFIGAGTKAYRYRSLDGLTDIGTFASSGGIYQIVPWDTWAVISNGVDPVEVWQNSGSSAAITAPFTRANTLFQYQLQVFAGGTNNGGQLVEYSPVNAVLDWTVTLTGTAGNLRLRDLNGDIVCAKRIGNSVGIYGRSNGGLFTFVGGTNRYGFRRPLEGVGAISPYSVVSLGDRHYGITQENAFVTDLVSFQLIDEPAVRDYIQQNTNWDRLTEVYGWADWANSMIRWVLPTGASSSYGLGYRWDNQAWTKFNDGVLLGENSGAFANMFLAKSSRLLRQDKTIYNNDGSAMSSWVRSKPLDFGNRQLFKNIQKISLDMTWTGDVKIKVGYSDNPNETPTWAFDKAVANEVWPDEPNTRSQGVFVTIEIYSTASNADWKFAGCEIFGETAAYVT